MSSLIKQIKFILKSNSRDKYLYIQHNVAYRREDNGIYMPEYGSHSYNDVC